MSRVTYCPACHRPTAEVVIDPLTRDEHLECVTGYSPCSPEQIEDALAGRRTVPQPGLGIEVSP